MTSKTSRREFVKDSTLTGLGFWLAGKAGPGHAADPLTLAEFEKLHKDLQPPADELWRTIPWKMSILEARALAVQEKKPLVLRVRSGHPLGCV